VVVAFISQRPLTPAPSLGEIPSRGVTVDVGEENTVECSDEVTTISTVAPRLDNHYPPQPALKRRPKLNRRSATDLITAPVRAIAILVQWPGGAKVAGSTPGRRAANLVQDALHSSKTTQSQDVFCAESDLDGFSICEVDEVIDHANKGGNHE
jgi:hypothetical protein